MCADQMRLKQRRIARHFVATLNQQRHIDASAANAIIARPEHTHTVSYRRIQCRSIATN